MTRELPFYLTVTSAQIEMVRGIQRRLRLPNAMLDGHCEKRFGRPFAELDRREVSALLDEMVGWRRTPAVLQIAQGQTSLPGVEA